MNKRATTIEQLEAAGKEAAMLSARVVQAAAQDMAELKEAKQDKPVKGSFTIPTSGWGTDSTTGYTKYYDIAVSGVTAKDRADVIIAPGSVNAAAACGLCPVSETLAGKVRIRATKVPTAAISAEYWIEKE